MKRKYAPLAIMATSLLVMLIMLQFNVELTIAQNLSNDAVSGPLTKEEHIMIWRDILMGKIDKPPGAKDYVPPENLESLPKPTPSLALDQMIFNQNMDLNLLMDYEGIAAGYQVFDGGCVYAQTNSITNLISDSAEYQVMHQWPTSGENAIVVSYYPNYDQAIFGVYISALGGYQDWAYFDPSDTFTLCIQPLYSTGNTSYSQITFYIYDDTTSTLWDETYSLGTTQSIKEVDYALEQDNDYEPNNTICSFTGFFALDANYNFVNLQSTFQWKEWQSERMENWHRQSYDGSYAYLEQAKTDIYP